MVSKLKLWVIDIDIPNLSFLNIWEIPWNNFKYIAKLVYLSCAEGHWKRLSPSLFMFCWQAHILWTQVAMFTLLDFGLSSLIPLFHPISFHCSIVFTLHIQSVSFQRVSYSKLDMILLGTYCFTTIPSTTSTYPSLPIGSYFDLHKPLLYSKPSKFASLVINGHKRM